MDCYKYVIHLVSEILNSLTKHALLKKYVLGYVDRDVERVLADSGFIGTKICDIHHFSYLTCLSKSQVKHG